MCLDPSPSFALQRRMRKHPTTSWKDFDVMRCVSLETVSVGLIVGRVAAASMEAKAALVSLAAAAALVESQSRERGLTAGATCVPSALAAVYGAVHGGTRRNAAWRAFAASATAAATGLGSSFFFVLLEERCRRRLCDLAGVDQGRPLLFRGEKVPPPPGRPGRGDPGHRLEARPVRDGPVAAPRRRGPRRRVDPRGPRRRDLLPPVAALRRAGRRSRLDWPPRRRRHRLPRERKKRALRRRRR
mmetsp:Transcript_16702/g.54375  ORF Transcript_16702/g.54375 Transcript_16702/m.54375 type:complete len:244 (+) Transcript_16702:110-841(+)